MENPIVLPLENLVMVSGDSICLDIEYVKNSISKLELTELFRARNASWPLGQGDEKKEIENIEVMKVDDLNIEAFLMI